MKSPRLRWDGPLWPLWLVGLVISFGLLRLIDPDFNAIAIEFFPLWLLAVLILLHAREYIFRWEVAAMIFQIAAIWTGARFGNWPVTCFKHGAFVPFVLFPGL